MDGTEEDADTYLEAYGVLKQNLPQLIVFNFNEKVSNPARRSRLVWRS